MEEEHGGEARSPQGGASDEAGEVGKTEGGKMCLCSPVSALVLTFPLCKH